MIMGILGKKTGMTQTFDERGARIPVTILEAGPCVVQDIKTTEKHGYNAVQLGFDGMKEKRAKKPQRENVKSKGLKPKRFVREIRCAEPPDVKLGDEIKNAIFQKGDFVDVTGISKGKGFQGGVKRFGWSGGKASHGSMTHRAPGSIGASSFPSRVFKGHSFPGHMGDEKVTVQNMEVVDVDSQADTIAVKGSLPGANGGYLIIRFARKKPVTPRKAKEEEKKDEPEKKENEEKNKEKDKDKGKDKGD